MLLAAYARIMRAARMVSIPDSRNMCESLFEQHHPAGGMVYLRTFPKKLMQFSATWLSFWSSFYSPFVQHVIIRRCLRNRKNTTTAAKPFLLLRANEEGDEKGDESTEEVGDDTGSDQLQQHQEDIHRPCHSFLLSAASTGLFLLVTYFDLAEHALSVLPFSESKAGSFWVEELPLDIMVFGEWHLSILVYLWSCILHCVWIESRCCLLWFWQKIAIRDLTTIQVFFLWESYKKDFLVVWNGVDCASTCNRSHCSTCSRRWWSQGVLHCFDTSVLCWCAVCTSVFSKAMGELTAYPFSSICRVQMSEAPQTRHPLRCGLLYCVCLHQPLVLLFSSAINGKMKLQQ